MTISKQRDTYLPLTPLTSDWMQSLFDAPEILQKAIEKYGSPINIHHTGPFVNNYNEYADTFEQHGLNYQVFFARKANKSKVFVIQAKKSGFGVDTASYQELKQCLEMGMPAERLVFTAAIKEARSIRLAIENDILIILDNTDECALTQQIGEELGKKATVGVRISGFCVNERKLYSRFGFDVEVFYDFMQHQFQNYTQLDYQGLHFHLEGYDTHQRGIAMHAAFDIAEKLQQLGHQTRFLDIGGGILMNYLCDKSQWQQFETELKTAVKGERPPITFGNNGLGYEMSDGELQGRMKVYPYFNELARATFLDQVLRTEQNGQTVAKRARQLQVEIRIEPGRSLLDQTGMTVAQVIHRKVDSRGDYHIGLAMNMTQMYSSSADFLLDPVVLFQKTPGQQDEAIEVFFTGAYCLERDVLLKRRIRVGKLPEKGDLVCFLNTAGYMMHFFESEAHLFDLAQNLVYAPQDMKQPKASDFRTDA